MREILPGKDRRRASRIAAMIALALLAAPPYAMAQDAGEAQGIVDKSRVTFENFMRQKNFEWMQDNLKNVKGLLIFPQVLKAGFFLGGSGGTGVLVARDAGTGGWSQPAFYTLGAVSFGLQFGGEASETIVMVMTQKALDSLFTSKFKLGGDVSVAAGPVGAGAKSNVTADFISFSMAKGLFAGVSLEGAVIDVRDTLNEAYYGKKVDPTDIIVKKAVSNGGSAALRDALGKAVK
ncbi:MAG TPA: lipid-binding SYLF domain-containing protein [Candidatus Aquicultoraceae bacterium]|jgi:lipid-binding SYLF domain-containing protein|nr:lipid-binding SYLF domain-containing protein [Candidatus Aquicultoraceae bacterium]